MLFTLLVAALAALVWALRSAFIDPSRLGDSHDPTTLELAAMAAITLAAYAWARRVRPSPGSTELPAVSSAIEAPHFAQRAAQESATAAIEEAAEHAA